MYAKFFLLAAAAGLLAGPAMAQMTKARYYSTPFGPVYTTMSDCREAGQTPDLRVLDQNHDNRVSSHEFEESGLENKDVSLFYSIDKNHDGFISQTELDAYRHVGKCQPTSAY